MVPFSCRRCHTGVQLLVSLALPVCTLAWRSASFSRPTQRSLTMMCELSEPKGMPPPSMEKLEILFRDSGLMVVTKPWAVRMDGPFEVTVETLAKEHFPDKVRFIHQLDFATSGLLMLGLDKATTRTVHSLFVEGSVRKEYLSLLEGELTQEVIVDAPICRWEGPESELLPPRGPPGTHKNAKDFRMMIGEGSEENPGRKSVTCITPLQHGEYRGKRVTLASMKPVSGRRHQLRLHSQHIGHGIVGDFTYSSDQQWASECERMMLHSWRCSIPYTPAWLKASPDSGHKPEEDKDGVLGLEGGSWGMEDGGRVWFKSRDPLSGFLGLRAVA